MPKPPPASTNASDTPDARSSRAIAKTARALSAYASVVVICEPTCAPKPTRSRCDEELGAADDVRAASLRGERPHDRSGGVRLHGVSDEVRRAFERGAKLACLGGDRVEIVDVRRRADRRIAREVGERDTAEREPPR